MSDTKKPDSSPLNAATEKLLRYVSEELTELSDMPKQLTLKEAKKLISEYGYKNVEIYLERLANYPPEKRNYTSPYRAINKWLNEDVVAGKIRIPEKKQEQQKQATVENVWTSDEANKARELFLNDYPKGAVIGIKGVQYKRVNGGGIQLADGTIIDAYEFISKHYRSYLYRAREVLEQDIISQNEAIKQSGKTNQELLAEALAKFQMKTIT